MGLQPLDPGTEFIRNPGGAVHDCLPGDLGLQLASTGVTGWKLATADEVKAYCTANNLQPPDLKTRASDIQKLLKEGQKEDQGEMAAATEAAVGVDTADREL